MGTPCIPPYCFWMLTKGSQRSFLGASDTSHSLPVHFVKQTRGSNQVNDVLTVPHWLLQGIRQARSAPGGVARSQAGRDINVSHCADGRQA